MTYLAGRRRGLGCTILAAVISIAAITLTPIGPLFVYGWLVPIISPVIPKPDEVPARSKAEYHWKGFGLGWHWDDHVTGACARWYAAESDDELVVVLHVFEGGKTCDDGDRIMSRLSFEDHMTFGNQSNEWPYEECPFGLDEGSVSRYLKVIEEIRDVTSGRIGRAMLEEMRRELMLIARSGLRAEQYGCRVDRE